MHPANASLAMSVVVAGMVMDSVSIGHANNVERSLLYSAPSVDSVKYGLLLPTESDTDGLHP